MKKKEPKYRPDAKSDATVRRHLSVLRLNLIEGTADPFVSRIAQAIEYGIRWGRSRTVGWPTPTNEALALAQILKTEAAGTESRT